MKRNVESLLKTPPAERKAIVAKIMDGYTAADGKLKWKRAYAEHPDWLEIMGSDPKSVQRAYQMVAAVRRDRQREAIRAGTNGKGTTPAPAGEQSERENLMRTIAANYRAGNRIMFALAWRDHPEWKAKLGADTELGVRKLYADVKKLHPKPKQKKTAAQQKADPPTGPAFEFHVMPHCPECGASLVEFFRMYNKMKAQQSVKQVL